MKNRFLTLNSLFAKLKGLIPGPLPIGMTDFNVWAQSIISTYALPDNPSIRWSIAVMVMQRGESSFYVSKFAVATRVRKAMANQIAAAVVQDLKIKQQEEIAAAKAAEAAKQVEATTHPSLTVVAHDTAVQN